MSEIIRQEVLEYPKEDCFWMEDIFVCYNTLEDETIEFAFNTGECVIYEMVSKEGEVLEHSRQETAVEFVTPEDTIQQLNYILMNSNGYSDDEKIAMLTKLGYKEQVYNEVVYYERLPESSQQDSKAASRSFRIGLTDLINKYPVRSGYQLLTTSFYCSYLRTQKTVIVRDDRNNYVESGSRMGTFLAGASIVVAAATLWIDPASLLNILGLASSVSTFPWDATVTRVKDAYSYRYRYGQVYDTTVYNAWVTTSSEWCYDYYTVSNQGNGYQWGEKPGTCNELFPAATIASDSANAYNYALNLNGFWPW